ncbi:HD domain-containing protein [Clostridium sp. DL1XJH146]
MYKKRLFKEFNYHLLKDDYPSKYLEDIFKEESVQNLYPFELIYKLKEIPQNKQYHPEGSVWNHTMLVVDRAATLRGKSKEAEVFMWAALLHDLGKLYTTKIKKGKITAYDHDKYGQTLAIKFLEEVEQEEEFIQKVSLLVRWHMNALFVVKKLPFSDIDKLVKEVPIDELALLTLCDRLGRGELDKKKEKEERDNIDVFVNKCREALLKD